MFPSQIKIWLYKLFAVMDQLSQTIPLNQNLSGSVEQRQKGQAHLFYCYNEAMKLLKAKNFQQGIATLEQILSSAIISETELRKLKKSVILSLANIVRLQNKPHEAFLYLYQALEIQRQIIRDEEESFDPNSTKSSEYELLMKMYQLTSSLGYHQHSVFLLKNALAVAPSLWQQATLLKLQNHYQSLEMHHQLTDLRKLRMNQTMFRKIIVQEQMKITHKCKNIKNQNENENQLVLEGFIESQKQQNLQSLKIQIKKQNSSYSSLEYLLTACYVLFKCQQKRNFNRKRYLHKKYDSSNIEWNQFLSEFSPIKTTIELTVQKQKTSEQQGQNKKQLLPLQNKDQINQSASILEDANKMIDERSTNQTMIEQLTRQLLRIKYTKKKKNKPKNPTPQAEIPVLPAKFTNKKYHVQQKTVYDSVSHYFNENFEKFQFNKDQITWIKDYFPQIFSKNFEKLIEKGQDDQNEGEGQSQLMQPSKHMKQANNEIDLKAKANLQEKKLNSKDKKQLEVKKIQFKSSFLSKIISQHSASRLLSQPIEEKPFQLKDSFNNISELSHFVINQIFEHQMLGDLEQQKDFSILKSSSIRKLIAKTLLKILPEFKCFLRDLEPKSRQKLHLKSYFVLDVLVEHFDFMSSKKPKNTEFTPHQNQKIQWLLTFIEEEFQIDASLIGNSPKSVQEYALTAIWAKSMLKFYTTKNNFSQQMIQFYKEICIFCNKKTKTLSFQSQSPLNKILSNFINQTKESTIELMIAERTAKLLNADESSNQVALPLAVSNKQPDIESLLALLQSNEPLTQEKRVFQRFVYFLEKYFEKIEEDSEAREEFSLKQIQFMTQKFKIHELIHKLYNKFKNPQSGIIKEFESLSGLKESILILLIKLCLMGSLNSNDDCLRILFYLTNIFLKDKKETLQNGESDEETAQNQRQKLSFMVYKIIILFRGLIELSEKKQKLESISLVLRKFYENIITKNLTTIYDGTKQQWKEKQERKQELNMLVRHQFSKTILDRQLDDWSLLDIVKTLSVSDDPDVMAEGQNLLSTPVIKFISKMDLQDQIMDIINGLYYRPESEFTPKKIEDSIGYFLFLSRNHSDEFDEEQLQLTNTVVKVFKKCYLVFADKKTELVKYCEKYKDTLAKVDKYWDGAEKQNTELIEILRGNADPCLCCTGDKILLNFDYSEIVYILARFFESNAFLEESDQSSIKRSPLQFTQLDQDYYKQYLLFNRKNPDAWINYIRVHCLKAYLYFDSLVSVQSIETFKNKFLFTKRIINFVKMYLLEPMDQLSQIHLRLKEFSFRTLNVLNILKLKERQFFMHLKQLQIHSSEKREMKQAKKKYIEGLKTIREKYDSLENITSIYLGTVELTLPEISFAELNSETMERISQLGVKVQETILSLDKFEKEEYSVHLEEDLLVEFYVIVSKMMEHIADQILKNKTSKLSKQDGKTYTLAVYNEFVSYWLNHSHQVAKNPKYHLHLQSDSGENQHKIIEERQVIDLDQDDLPDPDSISEPVPEQNNPPPSQLPPNKVFNFKPLENNEKLQQQNQHHHKNSQSPPANAPKKTKKTEPFLLDLKDHCMRKIKEKCLSEALTQEEEDILRKINTFFNAISTLFKSLPKYQTKRFKYRRSITTSLLYISQLYLKYLNEPSVSLEIIKDYFNIRSDEIVFIFTYSDRKSTEKNVVLSEFYNRAIVHNLQRLHFVKHLIDCFEKSQNIESLIVLIRKLNKVMVSGGEEENKEIKYLLMLYWYAADAYVNLVEKFAATKPIDERYEKILIEFKNRIKRSIESKFDLSKPDQNVTPAQNSAKESKQKALKENYYFERVDKFIKSYQQRFEKKVKLKKSKKERELEKELKEKGNLPRNQEIPQNQLEEKNSPLPEADFKNFENCQIDVNVSQIMVHAFNPTLPNPSFSFQKNPDFKKEVFNESVQIIENQNQILNHQEQKEFANEFERAAQDFGAQNEKEEVISQVAKSKKEKLKDKKQIKANKKQVVNLDSDEAEQEEQIQQHGKKEQKTEQDSRRNESNFVKEVKETLQRYVLIKPVPEKQPNQSQFIVIEDDDGIPVSQADQKQQKEAQSQNMPK